MATVLHRRLSLSDIEAPEAPTVDHPGTILPPKYARHKAGCRDEFFRDLDEYQVAAQIHAQHAKALSPTNDASTPIDETVEAPSYHRVENALPTIHETKAFKRRLLGTLRDIREYTERSRRTPKWSNCFGLSNKVKIAVATALLGIVLAAIVALAVKYQQVAGLLALSIFFLVHLGTSYFVFRKFFLQTRLVEALQIGLAKVEQFEKLDDVTLKRIKQGVSDTLSPIFWIDRERRMEEAIPEELQVLGPPPSIEGYSHVQDPTGPSNVER